jgi:hypothetical protein
MVLFVEGVSVISALLPAGDINLVGTALMKRWTGVVLEDALSPQLERWEHIFALCAGAGLTHLQVRPIERQAVALLPLQVAPHTDAVADAAAVELEELSAQVESGQLPDPSQVRLDPYAANEPDLELIGIPDSLGEVPDPTPVEELWENLNASPESPSNQPTYPPYTGGVAPAPGI